MGRYIYGIKAVNL